MKSIIFSTLVSVTLSATRYRQMTVSVAAGSEECFFIDNVLAGQSIDLEYQVTGSSGPTGRNDITVKLQTPYPSFFPIYQDIMVRSGDFTGTLEDSGDYRLCLDNRKSRISDKIVWFEVQIKNDEDDDYDDEYFDTEEMQQMKDNNEDTMTLFNMGVEEIKKTVKSVKSKLGKMKYFYYMNKAHMSKDSRQVEANFERINLWSMIHMILMVLVGVAQVYSLKSFFIISSHTRSMLAST